MSTPLFHLLRVGSFEVAGRSEVGGHFEIAVHRFEAECRIEIVGRAEVPEVNDDWKRKLEPQNPAAVQTRVGTF